MSTQNLPTHKRDLSQRPDHAGWKQSCYDIIFEADTAAGRWFDIALLIAILASIAVVSLETVPELKSRTGVMRGFEVIEWILTGLFTVEYGLRLSCAKRPLRYAFSFWGLIDVLSILPSFATLFLGGSSRSFVILRSIRLLRVFRVLKLWRMMNEADELATAIWRVRNKIVVFLAVVLVAVTISGTLMYHIETIVPAQFAATGQSNSIEPITDQGSEFAAVNESQFTSIPQSMYWAIVTMTTVGYGDVVPQTSAGKVISAMLILLGYSLIIVPSTFVSAEIVQAQVKSADAEPCQNCGAVDQHQNANYCYHCGYQLSQETTS